MNPTLTMKLAGVAAVATIGSAATVRATLAITGSDLWTVAACVAGCTVALVAACSTWRP